MAVMVFVFDSIDSVIFGVILMAYGIPKEKVKAIMMQYMDTFTMVRLPDGNTDFFQVFAYLQVYSKETNSSIPSFSLSASTTGLQSIGPHIECGFTLEQLRSSCYPAIYIMNAGYADDIAILSNV